MALTWALVLCCFVFAALVMGDKVYKKPELLVRWRVLRLKS